ncbi:MAG: hypothetical protein K8T90_16935 [Planctomycetes bacterium]|nr:hypothetical protein [Planctomycetota bacterium]
MPQLLALVMIVRNGGPNFERMLAAVAPYVDSWLILDTGSTDGSQGVARRVLARVPGDVVEEPFVDFATTRNRALDLAAERHPATWDFMPDDSYELHGGRRLRALLAEVPGDVAALNVVIRDPKNAYYRPLLTRRAARIRFRHPVHEIAVLDGHRSVHLTPEVCVEDLTDDASNARSTDRHHRDLEILRREHERDPACVRTTFHLAQTLACLGDLPAAVDAYRLVLGSAGANHFQAAEAAFRIAMISHHNLALPWRSCALLFLAAYEREPRRAEPLFHLAFQHYTLREFHTARLYISQAVRTPPPPPWPYGTPANMYEIDIPELGATIAYETKDTDLLRTCLERVARTAPDHPVLTLRQFLPRTTVGPRGVNR